MFTWVAQYAPLKLFCLWTKVHQISFSSVEGVAVDQVFFRCSICRSVPEIFAIEVESFQKSGRNLDVFLVFPNFRGQAFQKLYTDYHSCLTARSLEKFCEDSPTSPEVIEAHTLNFRPNF